MGFTPGSTAATYPCGECMWVSKAARKRGREAVEQPSMRTHADLAATAARLTAAKLTKAALADKMSAAGMNALSCVLQPDRILGADSVRDKPPDAMHLYGAGLSRIEPAHALEILFKPGSGLAVKDAWSELNVNVAKVNARLRPAWEINTQDLSAKKRQKGERAASRRQRIGGLLLHLALPYPD